MNKYLNSKEKMQEGSMKKIKPQFLFYILVLLVSSLSFGILSKGVTYNAKADGVEVVVYLNDG